MTKAELSPTELWNLGCSDKSLGTNSQKRFAAMARSRFHTFEMGVDHASKIPDDDRVQALIDGLAKEMHGAPGLAKIWHKMSVSQSNIGERVNLQLERLGNILH